MACRKSMACCDFWTVSYIKQYCRITIEYHMKSCNTFGFGIKWNAVQLWCYHRWKWKTVFRALSLIGLAVFHQFPPVCRTIFCKTISNKWFYGFHRIENSFFFCFMEIYIESDYWYYHLSIWVNDIFSFTNYFNLTSVLCSSISRRGDTYWY